LIRKELNANVAIELTQIWQSCVDESKEDFTESTGVWDCGSGLDNFLKTIKLIELYEPSFLEDAQVKTSFNNVVQFFRDKGENEVYTYYSHKAAPDEIENISAGYTQLSELFAGLSELSNVTTEDGKSFASISYHFELEARTLQERLPGEPDYDGSRPEPYSSGEIDVSELFNDL